MVLIINDSLLIDKKKYVYIYKVEYYKKQIKKPYFTNYFIRLFIVFVFTNTI